MALPNWLQGAGSGALAGASFGPWAAGIGALGGALLGTMQKDPKTADQMGLTEFDALSEAKKFMPSQAELNTQRNAFNASNNQNIDTYAKQLIASGMNPQQAYTVAQNKMASKVNQFEASQQQNMLQQQRSLGMGLLPRQYERQDDIASYNNMINSRPSFGEQALLGAGAVNMFRGAEGNNWLFNMFNKDNNTQP